jgi:hypothetical protein
VKYDKRGQHPNSLRNLKPRRKGMPSLNPCGRRGKSKGVVTLLDDPQWLAYVRQVERDAKLLDRAMRRNLGVSLDEAYKVLRKR